MAQNQQTLPSIAHLTNELPQQDQNRLSQNTDVRDSGNWSQSAHSSTVSNAAGLQLQTILNADDSPARAPGSVPDTPNSARPSFAGGPGKLENGPSQFESPPSVKPVYPHVTRGLDTHPPGFRGSLETPSALDSRRSSVDSRMNTGFGHLAISPQSPYDSQNTSRVSLVSNLQQQRGIPDSRTNGMAPTSPLSGRFGHDRAASALNGGPSRRAPVINPNPRNVSGMPDPTAAAPTKGYAWAFPDNNIAEGRRSTSEDSSIEGASIPSRQNSFAASMSSSIVTADSAYPPGQRRFDELDVPTHHHSMQHRAVTNLQSGEQGAPGSGNYSRTPELRVSHKMAERKRRSEMKNLFDELNSILPNTPGGKSSKWEVLTKAIEHIKVLKHADAALRRDAERLNQDANAIYALENDNKNLRGELSSTWQHLQRVEPNNHHVFGTYTNQLAMESHSQQQNGMVRLPSLTSAVPPQAAPAQNLPPFTATNGNHPAPMEGVTPHYQ